MVDLGPCSITHHTELLLCYSTHLAAAGPVEMQASAPPTPSSSGRECSVSSTPSPTTGGAPNMLDLVFCIDATGSMGPFIRAAQDNTCQIVEALIASEKCDIRFGLVAYRDHPPQDSTFITRKFEFTSSCSTMRANVDTLKARGGGDEPESVCCGLYDVLHMDWRKESTKIAILIADAPPHGIYAYGDGFPNGCPDGRDPIAIGHEMAEQGICVYTVGCGQLDRHRYAHAFMASLAEITHGQAVTLASAQQLVDVILGGAQEELGLERLMPVMEREWAAVVTDIGARRRRFGVAAAAVEESEEYQEEVLSRVHERMTSMGVQTPQLSHNSSFSAPNASSLVGSRSLGAWRSTVQPPPTAPIGMAGGTFGFRSPRSACSREVKPRPPAPTGTAPGAFVFATACSVGSATVLGDTALESESYTDYEPHRGIGRGRGGEMPTFRTRGSPFSVSGRGRGSYSLDPGGATVKTPEMAEKRCRERGSVTFGTVAGATEGRTLTLGDSSRGWSKPATNVTTRTEYISIDQVSRMMAKSQSRSCTKDDFGR